MAQFGLRSQNRPHRNKEYYFINILCKLQRRQSTKKKQPKSGREERRINIHTPDNAHSCERVDIKGSQNIFPNVGKIVLISSWDLDQYTVAERRKTERDTNETETNAEKKRIQLANTFKI